MGRGQNTAYFQYNLASNHCKREITGGFCTGAETEQRKKSGISNLDNKQWTGRLQMAFGYEQRKRHMELYEFLQSNPELIQCALLCDNGSGGI